MTENADIWTAVKTPTPVAPFAIRIHLKDRVLKTVRLETDVTYIGRMPENHVVLDDVKVSRSHARIVRTDNKQYVIEDQKSENGIFVKGKRVQDFLLAVGAKVTIGDHILEVVEAASEHQQGIRESHLEHSDEEEWRMDQTLSVGPEELRKMMERAKATKKKTKALKPPELNIDLEIAGKNFKKTMSLTQGRVKREDESPDSFIEVRVSFGKWILYKKEPL